MTFTHRGGFRSARSTRPATISNAAKRQNARGDRYDRPKPSKQELRDELAKAARNTASGQHKLYGARDYPL